MKMTLLEMVQEIMDAMVSDKVNSLSGDGTSEEAAIVANFIKTTYYEIIGREDWDFLTTVGVLEAVSDVNRPNYLKVPALSSSVRSIRYNVSETAIPKMREIQKMDKDEFIDYLYSRNSVDDDTVQVVTDFDGAVLPIRNNKFPQYYTSFDDEYLIFDSYNSDFDSTLQSSKSMATLVKTPQWETEDDFIPTLPVTMFPLLLAEAKDACFQYLRQTRTEKDAKRQYRHGSHQRHAERRVKGRSPRKGFGRSR